MDPFEIIQEQGEGGVFGGQTGDQFQRRVAGRLAGMKAAFRLPGQFHHRGDGRLDAGEEALDVVVGVVQGQPGCGHALGLKPFQALRHQRGFTEARWRLEQHQLGGTGPDHGVTDAGAGNL